MNFNWLQQTTEEIELLGFVRLMDGKIEISTNFARCFSHPENYCYAEISEVFRANGESDSRNIAIVSVLTKGWSLYSINREAKVIDAIPYGFWRDPKSVRIYHPYSRLEDLLNKHLQMRQRMIDDINISLLTDISWENYVRENQKLTIYRKKAFKQKILLFAMIEVTKFELNPKSEWLGDYAKFIRTR